METVIMALSIEPRSSHAPKVQSVLTNYGCIIKTRLGIHETTSESCSQKGLILLELCCKDDEAKVLKSDLENIEGVKVNYMNI